MVLPEPVTKNDDLVLATLIFFRRKDPAQNSFSTRREENICRGPRLRNSLRVACSRKVYRASNKCADMVKVSALAKFQELWLGNWKFSQPARGKSIPDSHNSLRIFIW